MFNPFKKKVHPLPLPMGRKAFEEFADAIYEGAQVPGLTKESAYFSIASMILHKPSTESFASQEYFVHALRKAAANEVANAILQELTLAKKAKMKADYEAKLAVQAAQPSEVAPTNEGKADVKVVRD